MKNILKTIIFAFALIAFGSCEHDADPIVSANGFTLRTAESLSPVVLIPQNDANTVATLQWDKSDNGGFTSVSQYKVEVAESGTNFAAAITANSGNPAPESYSYVLTVAELNALANQLPGYQCGVQMDIDVRIKSTLGNGYYNEFTQYSSNVITLTVTPYSSALPTLAFSATGTGLDSAPKLAASAVLNTDYEGYMWLDPGTYKFYKPNACGGYDSPAVYGDDGGGSFNTLVADGAGYQVVTAGYFLVKADTVEMTYSVRPTTWNVFGTAKQNFPLLNVPMVYNQATKKWELNITLANGYGVKFRSNGNSFLLGKFLPGSVNTSDFGGNTLSYVPNTPDLASLPNNELIVPGEKTNPKTLVNYDIALDLSSPRNYTYTITVHQ